MIPLPELVVSPRLHRRGPTEARFQVLLPIMLALSPRLHRRGPIEACGPSPV